MTLTCESSGLGPHGPLSTAERRVYNTYLWTSPQAAAAAAAASPAKYVYHTIFHSHTLGLRPVDDFPEPMAIDSPSSPAGPPPAPPQKMVDDSDVDMEDAPAPRRVQFTPPPDYSRPASSLAFPPQHGSMEKNHHHRHHNLMPRTALSKRIHIINELEAEVPKEPWPMNSDVDYSHPSLHDSLLGSTTPLPPPPAAPPATRPTNTFTGPDDSFTELSPPDYASTPLPFSPRFIPKSGLRIAPPKQRTSPQGRPILSPVSPREARQGTSPPHQRVLSPDALYPTLKTIGRKRRLEDDIGDQDEQGDRPQTVTAVFFGLIRSAILAVADLAVRLIPYRRQKRNTQEQEIFALRLPSRGSSKRRAMTKADLDAEPMPGYYPGTGKEMEDMISPEEKSRGIARVLRTPPDSRPGSSMEKTSSQPARARVSPQPARTTKESRSMPNITQEYKRQDAQLPSPTEESSGMEKLGKAPTACGTRTHNRTASLQPPLQPMRRTASMGMSSTAVSHGRKSEDASQQRVQSRTLPYRYRTADYRKARFVPFEDRSKYTNALPPKEDRAESNKEADDRVTALVEKARRATIESPQQKALRESYRARKFREEQEKIQRLKALKAQKAEEEARIKAEREAEEARKKAEEERELAEKVAAAKAIRRQQALENFLPSISSEWQDRIAEDMATQDPTKVLASSTRGVELTRKTFGCILPQQNEHQVKAALDPGARRGPAGWLNDEGVDGFIGAIVDRKREQEGWVKGKSTPSFAALGCQWFTTVRNGSIKSISRWARRQQIGDQKLLECEKIFLPVNTGAHWVLLIISPKARSLEFLDSAGGSGKSFFKLAREFLAMELGTKYVEAEWQELPSKSGQQLNMDDCGVFTCMNALASARGVGFDAVRPVKDMLKAREFITGVLLDGGFGRSFEL